MSEPTHRTPRPDDTPSHRFANEIIEPGKDLTALTPASNWTVVAVLHTPAMVRDNNGTMPYTYGANLSHSANGNDGSSRLSLRQTHARLPVPPQPWFW